MSSSFRSTTLQAVPVSPVMKRNVLRLAVALSAGLILSDALPALGQNAKPPTQMTYQGFLSDSNGLPYGNTSPVNKTVIFRIYDALTGGTLKWSSQQVVTIDKGYFSVLLGQGSANGTEPFSADLTSLFTGAGASDRYLELNVDGTTIAPRLRFYPSPYALLSKSASDLIDPLTGTSVLTISGGNINLAGSFNATGVNSTLTGGAVTANSTTATHNQGAFLEWNRDVGGCKTYLLNQKGGGPGGMIFGEISTANVVTETMRIEPNGRVGVNAPNVKETLDVGGNIHVTGGNATFIGFNTYYNNNAWRAKEPGTGGYIRKDNSGLQIAVSPNATAADAVVSPVVGMVVSSTGSIGVKTYTPTADLEVNGTAKATSFQGFGTVPVGAILMWSGSTSVIPAGWALCNGQNVNGQQTPNLTDRFIVAAGNSYQAHAIGGSTSVSLTSNNLPTFTIPYSDIYYSEKGGTETVPSNRGSGDSDGDNKGFEISRTATYTGSATAFSIMPPYYALAFIMRVQ